MESQRDEKLRHIHNAAGLVIPDGMPLVWLGHLMESHQVARVYRSDLMLWYGERSLERSYCYFFYGGAPGVADKLVMK